MSEVQSHLLEFVQVAAHHSGIMGDRLASVFAAASACLTAGIDTPQVAFAAAPLLGEDLLVVHETQLLLAVADGGLAIVEGSAPEGAVVDTNGAAWITLSGVAGLIGALRLTPPPGGWDDSGASLDFARTVGDELAATVLRHWQEQQHLDRAAALLEAQHHTHVGSFEWDIVADKVRWSDELFRIFGSEPQSFEPTFEEFLERIHADDRDAVRASVYEAYAQGSDYRIEERIVRPDGSVRQLASWGHVVVNEQALPVKIIGSCQDVTDLRFTMHELATTERRLAEVQERRSRALELNDNIVQGLASALYAVELGLTDQATTALRGTLQAARTIIGDLLQTDHDGIDLAGLTRSEPARSFLQPAPNPPAAEAATNDPIRVVIADDSSDIRLLTTMILSTEADFVVVAEACTGEEAILQVVAHQPALLLLDLSMPVLDGLSAIPAIHAGSPDTIIVAFSGFSASSAADEALERGAHAYVEKGRLDVALPVLLREIHLRGNTEAPLIARSGH